MKTKDNKKKKQFFDDVDRRVDQKLDKDGSTFDPTKLNPKFKLGIYEDDQLTMKETSDDNEIDEKSI